MCSRIDDRFAAIVASLLLAGCSTLPSADTSNGIERRQSMPRTESAQPNEIPIAEAPVVEAEALNPIDEVLATRRRGDYPEVEADETGFTITEQVRISGSARGDYERALQLLRQERYDEGIPLLASVTESIPEVTAPYVDLGIAYGRQGDLDAAETALETAALLSPDHPIVHNELGILYRKTGRFAEARIEYEKALSVFAEFHFAQRNLAVLCDLYLADLDCALEHYTAYLENVPDDAEVAIWVSDIRNRLGPHLNDGEDQ